MPGAPAFAQHGLAFAVCQGLLVPPHGCDCGHLHEALTPGIASARRGARPASPSRPARFWRGQPGPPADILAGQAPANLLRLRLRPVSMGSGGGASSLRTPARPHYRASGAGGPGPEVHEMSTRRLSIHSFAVFGVSFKVSVSVPVSESQSSGPQEHREGPRLHPCCWTGRARQWAISFVCSVRLSSVHSLIHA